MAMKIRLARGGSKKRPFYRIVAADSRMPRDGRFKEKLGTYNPLLPKDSEERVRMNLERIQYWLDKGAKPTDRIARFLEAANVLEPKHRSNPIKGKPHDKTVARAEAKAAKSDEASTAADTDAETVDGDATVPTGSSDDNAVEATAKTADEISAEVTDDTSDPSDTSETKKDGAN